MDVLRPRIIDLGGRYYRCSPASVAQPSSAESALPAYVEGVYEDDYDEDDCAEECVTINEMADGKLRSSLQFPSVLFRHFIGKGGEIKQRNERETNTRIDIPKRGAEGDVVVIGHDRHGVVSACRRLRGLAMQGRRREEWTHLLCVPLVGVADVVENCQIFKQTILDTCSKERGMAESIFQNPLKLHLTLGTLKLLSPSEIDDAIRHLEEAAPALRGMLEDPGSQQPPVIHIKGIEYMNDDPSEVDILYAEVELQDGSNRLQEMADFVVDRLVAAGVMEREYERVKLHATVINTKLRKAAAAQLAAPAGAAGPKAAGHHRHEPRETFDATRVLKDFSHFDFGAVPLTQLHLSRRYTAGADQFYECAHRLPLTNST